MKKVVFKLEFYDEKIKQKAMQSVSGLSGVESISVDMKEKKLTVIGDIDPVKMAAKLRKICHTDILTVGPAKEPEKKKDDQPAAAAAPPKKDEPKKEEPKKMSIVLPKGIGGNGGGGGGGGGGDEKKKDVKALVPVTGFPPAGGPGPGPGPVLHHQGQLVKSFPEPFSYVQYPPAQALQPYNHYNQYPPPQALQPYQQYPPQLPAPAYYSRSQVEEDPNSCVIC